MKKSLLFLLIVSGVVALSGCTQEKESLAPAEDNSAIIFFYGEECPHCKIVEKFLAENTVKEKIEFSEREVYHNEANGALFVQKANGCGIKEKEMGVPMLWNEGQCLMGDQDIINFFKTKINEKK